MFRDVTYICLFVGVSVRTGKGRDSSVDRFSVLHRRSQALIERRVRLMH